MKILFFISALCLTQIIYSQTTKKTTTKSTTTKTNPSKPKHPVDFKKTIMSGDSLYSISGTVMIKNGHDEKVKVLFTAAVSKDKWNELTSTKKYSDYEAFDLVASILALDAKYKLKNVESFVPLPSQFFTWSSDNNTFICNFKMMGRNGYGNLSETTALVEYNPFKETNE